MGQVVIFQTGRYTPGYGNTWEVTDEILGQLKKTFDEKVLGSAVSVYYGHWDSKRTAAGEVKSLSVVYNEELNKHQLVGDIKWTPNGGKAVKDREYKYISAEVTSEFRREVDAETTKKYGPVLLGAALVNEPGVYDIPPIVYSFYKKSIDKFSCEEENLKIGPLIGLEKEEVVDELLKKLGFASTEELEKAFNNLSSKLSKLESGKEQAAFEAKLSVKDAEITSLKEKIDKIEEDHFTEKKTAFLNSLFASGKITKEKHDALAKYTQAQFEVFKEVWEENFSKTDSALPTPKGTGADPAKLPDDPSAGKVIDLKEHGKSFAKSNEHTSFFKGVK